MVQIPYVDGAETAKLYPLQRYPQALKLSSQDYMGSKMVPLILKGCLW